MGYVLKEEGKVEKRMIILYCIIAILLAGNIFQFVWNNTSQLSVDAVPDEETALKIAEAVLVSAYGNNVLSDPLKVAFNEAIQVWCVYGTLPEGYVGGVPEIYIQKSDGKILKIYHSM